MLDLKPEAGMKFGRQPLPVAMGGVALVAQEAQRPPRSRDRGFRKRSQLIEFMLGLRGFQMALENAQPLVGMTPQPCDPRPGRGPGRPGHLDYVRARPVFSACSLPGATAAWRRTLRPAGLLLLGQGFGKHGLFDIRFQRATRGADERIGPAIL